MITWDDVPSVKTRMNKERNKYFMKEYGNQILDVINSVYTYLVSETDMLKYLSCKDNSERNIVDMFNELVDRFILNYAMENTMPIYNVMTETGISYDEPKPFCELWRTDLFNYMRETVK